MKTILKVLLTIITLSTVSCKQRLYNRLDFSKEWYCPEYKACMILNNKGKSYFDYNEDIKFSLKPDRLKIIDLQNQGVLFNKRSTYWFDIVNYSKDTLILNQDLGQNAFELPSNVNLIFIDTIDGCKSW